MNWLAVFVGGGLGSLCRYGVARILEPYALKFPWATIIANLLASALLGILMAAALKSNLQSTWRLLWMVGFCGGFSTFSTFTAETFLFFEQGQWLYGLGNILLSLTICLFGFYLGFKIVGN